jgi:hypothetical protein
LLALELTVSVSKDSLDPMCWDGYWYGWDEMASLKLDCRFSLRDEEIDEMSVSKQGTNNNLVINLLYHARTEAPTANTTHLSHI